MTAYQGTSWCWEEWDPTWGWRYERSRLYLERGCMWNAACHSSQLRSRRLLPCHCFWSFQGTTLLLRCHMPLHFGFLFFLAFSLTDATNDCNVSWVLSRSDSPYCSCFWEHWFPVPSLVKRPTALLTPHLSDLCPQWHSDGWAKGPTDLHRNQGRDWGDKENAWKRHFSWTSWPEAGLHSEIWKQESAVGGSETDVAKPALRQPSKMSFI